jgi:small-conductance mechanosensitive channel
MKNLMQLIGVNPNSEWFEFTMTSVRIALIMIAAWLLTLVTHKLIKTLRIYLTSHSTDNNSIKRAQTLGRATRHISSVIITIIAGMLILNELGISIAPILAAAGVVGVAVGFGAQSVIKDYISGFFILLEDQIRHGEVVEAGGKSGLVEDVTLRHVVLRDYSGNMHFIPNGDITTVTNMSRDFSHAVIDVGVAYREDVDQVYDLMKKLGEEMRNDPNMKDKILEDLEIAGIDNWADSAVIIRSRFKVIPLEQWGVRREFLYRLKKIFDREGIEIPFPHLTVYAGQGKHGEAPPFILSDQSS